MSTLKFNAPLDLLGLEVQNLQLQTLATNPTGREGMLFYHSGLKSPVSFDGTDFFPLDARKATGIPNSALLVNPLARANHTGTQLAATISNLATTVKGYLLSEFGAPSAPTSWGGQRLTNLATPTAGTDGATKAYVDSAAASAVTEGTAAVAVKLQTPRSFSLTGVMTAASQTFDGTANLVLTTAIADGALSIAKTSGLAARLTTIESDISGKQAALGFTPVNKAGDTLTGPLVLAADPTQSLHAAPKQYVDAAKAAAIADAIAAAAAGNATTATRLQTARTIALSGIITATGVSFDGSANISLATAIADNALSIAKTSGLQAALNAKQNTLGFTPVNKAGDTLTGFLLLHADPTLDMHPVTKRYMEQIIEQTKSGSDPKDAINAAFGTNQTLSGYPVSGDYQTVAGDSVLLYGQTNAAINGIYTITGGGGVWARRSDAVQGKLSMGAETLCLRGADAGVRFFLNSDDPITVGTTAQQWIKRELGKIYTAGDGLDQTLTEFKVKARAGGGIVVGANGVEVDITLVARKKSFSVGNAVDRTFTLTHNLGTTDLTFSCLNVSTGEHEFVSSRLPNANQVVVEFAGPIPTASQYRITLTG